MTARRLPRIVSFASLCFASSFVASPLLAQCPDGSPPPCAARGASVSAAGASANSVGVMLFNNQTRDTAYAYLSDGLATEIATSLARVPRLEVRSPGAVRTAMRGVEADPRTVGRRLNVRYVVEGDFQRGGDRIRVSVRLVAVPTGTQRWSDAYTRPIADLLAVQEEIAASVASAIAGQLLPQERQVLAVRPTANPEAYDHVLRGNFQLARRTPVGASRAIEEYSAAALLDPRYAVAHARIGLAYALFLDWGWDMPGVSRDSQVAIGMRAADRALAIDSSSADGWMSRGYLLAMLYPRTLDGVLEALQRSVTLDPRNAEAWHQYGSWLVALGRWDEGSDATRRALALEPGRSISWFNIASALEPQRKYAEARLAYDSVIAYDPEQYAGYAYRAFLRLGGGDLAGARADAEASERFSPPSELYYALGAKAAVAAASGDTVEARAIMRRALAPFETRDPGPLVTPPLAAGLVALGDRDGAIRILERTVPLGGTLWVAMQFRGLAPLANDPRYQRLLEQIRPHPAH